MINLIQAHPLFCQQTALGAQFHSFQQKILSLAQAIGLDLSALEIDHLAVRVNSQQKGQDWLDSLLKYGTLLSDNIVNGRAIYLVTLSQEILFAGQGVSIIELPMPKNRVYPQEGWEHIEVVIPFLIKESPNEWQERIIRQFGLNENPLLRVKVSEPKVAGEKLCNISLAITFVDKTKNDCCIKLHPYHITDVVKQER